MVFVHSVKPSRLFKAAANALRSHSQSHGQGQPLHLLLQTSRRGTNKKVLYRLVVQSLKYEQLFDQFFKQIDLFALEPRLDPWLARILLTELVLAERPVTDKSKPVLAVQKYYKKHRDLLESLKTSIPESNTKEAFKPRYVRINTLRLSTADAVRNFQDEGWNLVRCASGSYDDYLRQLENLGENDFIPDYHVKVVFAFPPKTSFSGSASYANGEIFLQDKATCLAAYLLAPKPGSTVLDMCAAPGMKTTHLAAIMKNEGTIYSVEQDKPRSEVLCKFIESSGTTCVKVLNKDAARVTKIDCPDVDYVLLDPSCSGSGISRIENNNSEHDLKSGRLHKLSAFQAKLLRHALNEFRSAKRVVYSTCSLYPQENEEVVRDVLQNHKGKYKLVSARGLLNDKWNNTGDLQYVDIGEKCLYAKPDSDYTSGFFIAVFEKSDDEAEANNSDEIKNENSAVITEDSSSKSKNKETSNENIEPNLDVEIVIKKKKSKKKHSENIDENVEEIVSKESTDDAVSAVKKSKKSKSKVVESCELTEVVDIESKSKKEKSKNKHSEASAETSEVIQDLAIKKKKNKKNKDELEDSIQSEHANKRKHDSLNNGDSILSEDALHIKKKKKKKKHNS